MRRYAPVIIMLIIPVLLFSQEEDPAELMDILLGDSNVDFFLSGNWKGSLQGNIGVNHTPLGWAFYSPETPLLYMQEADITLSLWIKKTWFVEANFRDESSQNTYRAGYQGLPGGFIKYVGIGNTGLDFPSFPYLDLGGDSPSSFGLYSRMGNDSLDIHALFRYDTASREERVFSGGREKTTSNVEPDNFIRGVSFVLPDKNIISEITVYLEDKNGGFTDGNGKRWRAALNSEYAAGGREGFLELGFRPEGMVAVFYNNVGDNMGSYSGGSPNDFLFDIQDYFKSINNNIDLEKYPQCGDKNGLNKPDYILINGNNALVIFEPGTFSPFERLNRYDAPSSASEQAQVVYKSSGSLISKYELVSLEESAASGDLPLYAQVVSRRSVYELLHASVVKDRRNPQSLWPLAQEYPEIYLPGRSVYTGDAVLRFTNYSGVQGYFIGNDVVPGSVQVWRSGIQDSNFTYIPGSGQVILNSPSGQNENIRITYLKRSEKTRLGSIAAGLGAVYKNESNPFSVQGAAGIRWNITDDSSYTDESNLSAGTAGVSAKAALDFDFLKTHITAGFTFAKTDTIGLYRAAGMEGHQLTLFLPPETSFISRRPNISGLPSHPAGLIYKNYYDNSVLGSTLMPINWTGWKIVPGMNKPYPAIDPLLWNSQVLAAEFVLEAAEWTGFQVPIENNADFISRAGQIFISFRLDEFDTIPPNNLRIIIQIGDLSENDLYFIENPALIWQKDSGFNEIDLSQIDGNGRYMGFFLLDEEDRKLLGKATGLRLIAINEDASQIRGRVILAPPVFYGSSFRSLDNRVRVTETIETEQPFLEETQHHNIIKRLHPNGNAQRVLKVEWDDFTDRTPVFIDGRIGQIPLKDYNEISFFYKASENNATFSDETLKFIIAAGPESTDKPYLSAEIPLNNLVLPQKDWHKITVRYRGNDKGISVNGNKIDGLIPEYYPGRVNSHGGINYAAFFIEPGADELAKAVIYIDEIILEDPLFVYRINAGSFFEYKKTGEILSIRDLQVINDFSFFSAIESEIKLNDENNESGIAGGVATRSGLEAYIMGARVRGNVSFTALDNDFFWSADHSVSGDIKGVSFKESFYASPFDENAQHTLNFSYLSNFFARFNADVLYEFSKLWQTWLFDIGYMPENELFPAIALNSSFSWQKENAPVFFEDKGNYAKLWAESWSPLVPDLGGFAKSRNLKTEIIINQRTKPVGAVLTMEGIINFTQVNNLTRLENSLFLDVPATIKNNNITLRLGRTFQRHLSYSPNNAAEDAGEFFESIGDCAHLWEFFPIYSLFTPNLNKVMDNTLIDSTQKDTMVYTSFNDHFSIRANLPRRHDLFAFLIPQRSSLRLDRVIENKMDTRSDILNLSANIGFSALNMFGSMGQRPLFKLFQNDEYNYSMQVAFAFNNNEYVSWRLQSLISAVFRLSNSGNINFINTLTFRDKGYWSESFIFNMMFPSKNSLINVIYKGISGFISKQSSWQSVANFLNAGYEQFRRESVELAFDKTDYLRWNIIFGHEAVVRASGSLEFSGFLKFRFGEDLYRQIFSMDLLLGLSLKVSF